MSVTRNYFGDRSRERPAFNYRRNDRQFSGNVPTSRHSIFIRGFPSSVSAKQVKNFFVDETRSNVVIDFVSYTDDHKKLCVAVRFETTQIARDMYAKFNNREILGHTVEFSWFKDMKAVKGKFGNDRRFNNNNNYNNRQPRRFIDRRSRSKQRYRDNFDKRRDYKSHSRSRDSVSSSSFSKSRSGSDSLSDRSSTSATRLIRTINKDKYKRRHTSIDSYSSKDRSKDRNETKSDTDNCHKKRKRSTSRKRSEEKDKFEKSAPGFEYTDKKETVLPTGHDISDSDVSRVKIRSTELLDDYSKDIEKYLSVINVLIGKNQELETVLVGSLKDILGEIGAKYVQQFVTFVDDCVAADGGGAGTRVTATITTGSSSTSARVTVT